MRLHLPSVRNCPASARRRATALRLRPRVEGLEDRAVPATMVAHPLATVAPVVQHIMTTTHATASAPLPAPISARALNVHATSTQPSTILTLNVSPIDLNLLGLEVKLFGRDVKSPVTVNVSAQSGSGNLLGNLLTTVSGLLNLQGVNNTLNTVLGNVITLVNQSSLHVAGVNSPQSTAQSTTPVLDAFIAPVHLNLLGALVDTSPIHLQILAHSGSGLVLGNILTSVAHVLDTPPANGQLTLTYVENQLKMLLGTLNSQLPNIPAAPTTPVTIPSGSNRILSLNLAPINLNLLGLNLQTSTIQVNADAQAGSGNLLGNLLVDVLTTLHASQTDLNNVNNDLNGILAKVVGVLNATSLTLPANALSKLSQPLQQLAQPNLITPGPVTTPQSILDLTVASEMGGGPPVDVNLLGVVVTTSNIHAQLLAKPGQGQILGNLLYNVSHLLDPGGALNVLAILDTLGL